MDPMQHGLFGVPMNPNGEIEINPAIARENQMYQEMNDPVDVLVLFEKGTLKPQRFRWKGNVHRVAQITGDWKTTKGQFKVRHFAVMDEDANFFQLAYDERLAGWKVTRVWVE